MTDIIQWSATETRAALAAGQVSAVEVVEAHLARHAAVHPALNAVVETLADEARARAKALDGGGQKDAPLFGVPVTVKINIDQKGTATSNGIAAFNKPQQVGDSPVVQNFNANGAVIIGRTNTPEFSLRWFTSNPLHGATYNPHNRTLTPGGSSGGASASVAAGVGCIAHGNDLGGSLRYPAYCCGVATIRPSLGCVPAFNPSAAERPPITQLMSVQGPIARTVADVRLGLDVMRQRSALDPLWTEVSPAAAPAAADSGGKRKLKIGYAPDPFGDGGGDAAVAQALAAAADYLRDAGAEVVEATPPDADECVSVWGDLLFSELRHTMLPDIERHGSAPLLHLLHTCGAYFNSSLSMADYFRALQRRVQLQRAWLQLFEEVDLLLLPVSMKTPFENELDFKTPEVIPSLLKAQRPLCMVNLLGLPAAQVPVCFAPDGAPVGVQLVGALRQDYLCLRAAEWIEQRNGLSTRPIKPSME